MLHVSNKVRNTSVIIAFLSASVIFALVVQAVVIDGNGTLSQKARQADKWPGLSKYVEGEVLVVFKRGVKPKTVDSIADSVLADVVRTYSSVSRITGKSYAHMKSVSQTTEQMIQRLKQLPEVESVSPNYRRHIDNTVVPDDPRADELWGLHNTGQEGGVRDVDIDAPEAWKITRGSSGVIVAVIDTGIDYNHPDLIANLWTNPDETVDGVDNDGNGYIDDIHGINAITASGDPMDDHGHGTHCSGTIGAVGNNGTGIVGVNWEVRLMGMKFIDASGYGEDADAITCMDYIIDKKTTWSQNIVAVNASWGGVDDNAALEEAITALGTAGVVFCASAGNDYTDNDVAPHYPSNYTCSNLISVTAVDRYGDQYYNYGLTSVDLGAPGRSILSSVIGQYIPQTGDPFYDDMESGDGLWKHGGTLDSWAITDAAAGGLESYWWDMDYGNFWSDSPGIGYTHNVASGLAPLGTIDLSSYAGQPVYLSFEGGFQFDYFVSGDTARVEITDDGGSSWSTLADLSVLYFGYGYYYIKQDYAIPESYKTADFKFRFIITTDNTDYGYYGYRNKGWIIDNVGVGSNLTYDYESWNGTSMATPHVTGVVALIAARFPSETVAQRVARILNSTAPLASLSGLCVTGGLLNARNALLYTHPPEMNVKRKGINFPDGSTTDMGTYSVDQLVGKEFTFTIENTGLGSLNLTGIPRVYLTGPDAADFNISLQPVSPVAAGGTTVFKLTTVKKTVPTLPSGWQKTYTFDINIENNDADENPYNFTISVTAKKY
ncbi:MAG: S8 family serine peptidase [Candidatus Aminicenantes bacterium]|nr:S8 family serine peptidase [Candidatus Aminicenantes bacterium]